MTDVISYQLGLILVIITGHDCNVADIVQLFQSKLDLCQFDSITPNFYLEILTPQVDQATIFQSFAKIAGEIDLLRSPLGIVQEGFSG